MPPRYGQLPRPDDGSGLPLSWGVWGPDDQVGTLNRITDATVAAAAGEIRRRPPLQPEPAAGRALRRDAPGQPTAAAPRRRRP